MVTRTHMPASRAFDSARAKRMWPLICVCYGAVAFLSCGEPASDELEPTFLAGRSCGDGVCGPSEHCRNCPDDCGECTTRSCGDGVCAIDETCTSCRKDCGKCPAQGGHRPPDWPCGNGECSGAEACDTCPQDCGGCPATCGDGTCDANESCASCASDCGACPPPPPTCGDGSCADDENCDTCASDCGACPPPPAGDGSGGTGGTAGTRVDWPCDGCITSVPESYDQANPIPLLIALHDDSGTPKIIHSFLKTAAMTNGYILLAPQCPRDLGCDKTWSDGSWHPQGNAGTIAWINEQIDQVEAAYNVHLKREYLIGGSGGAVYIGYFADQFAPRIAGVAMVSGGWSARSKTCLSCSLPVYILIGDQDFLLSRAEQARDWYNRLWE